MNEINRELKGYTASGTSISLGYSTPRRMGRAHYIRRYLNVGFLRSRSHIRLDTGGAHTSSGNDTITRWVYKRLLW